MRPGFGTRHPALRGLLDGHRPDLTRETAWADGRLPLRISAYTTTPDLPRELVTSARCLVVVDGRVVVCANEGGTHPWPGGRLEPGESVVDAAVREVHEETGWRLDRASVRRLGWLHCELLSPQGPDYPFPHPDFLQVVVTGVGTAGPDGEWRDTDGYEQRSWLATVDEAEATPRMDPVAVPFLDLVRP